MPSGSGFYDGKSKILNYTRIQYLVQNLLAGQFTIILFPDIKDNMSDAIVSYDEDTGIFYFLKKGRYRISYWLGGNVNMQYNGIAHGFYENRRGYEELVSVRWRYLETSDIGFNTFNEQIQDYKIGDYFSIGAMAFWGDEQLDGFYGYELVRIEIELIQES